MIAEQQASGFLNNMLITTVVSGIRRLLVRNTNATRSIPYSASHNYVSFPVVITDDISRDVAMDIAKTVEIKMAYDVKRILERNIRNTPRDARYNEILDFLPVNREVGNAIDLTAIDLADDAMKSVQGEMTADVAQIKDIAITFAKEKINSDESEYYSEAHSAIVKERGSEPTSIDVEIKYVTQRDEIKTVTYNMAINAIPRYVESNTLQMKLSTYDTKRFYRKYVKLMEKEETFIKDFLLDIDLMKQQAKDSVEGTNQVFRQIEKSNLKRDIGLSVFPFTVFIFSEDFVERVKDKERLDIYEESSMIMKKLMAMGIFIYDADTDLVNIKYDGDKEFSTYPFDEVTGETSKYEKELRQLVKLNR
jgi:hypothetical protein